MPASRTPTGNLRPARELQNLRSAPAAAAAETVPERASECVPERRPTGSESARRALDIIVSASALVLLLPVFALIAAGIKLSSPGPVLYHQVRVGLNRRRGPRRDARASVSPGDRRARADRRADSGHGRPFRIYKFRTMAMNAEEYGPQWSHRGDSRIFPFGRFLRLTRLDETPQFLNVLRGDMSLIGPRPERPYFVERFAEDIPGYRNRLSIRPGITGRAQVTLDYDSCVDDVRRKLEQDLLYIEERSLRRDLAILCRTVWVVLTGKGAA